MTNINRREFLKTVGAGAVGVSSVGFNGIASIVTCAKTERKPNIVLVMADDQGWGDVGYYDHPVLKTPNLDSMASEGLRFDRFYAASPVCTPTRGSVLTGRHPNRFGAFRPGYTLRPQELTLAEALKKAGYITGHFGKWHLGSIFKGSPVSPQNSGFDEWCSTPNFFDNDPIFLRDNKAVQMFGESSEVTVDAAIEFIEKHYRSEKPFFSVIWFGSPHSPHKSSEENRDLYASSSEHMANYYGEITGIDNAVGKLRKKLRELGISNNTIVWYCSDNGGKDDVESVRGGRGDKGNIYEGGIRIPAIIEWPDKIKEHRITNVPGNTSDIFPTLLEIANIRIPEKRPLDGVSLVGLITDNMSERPPMGFWHFATKGIPTRGMKMMAEMLENQKKGIYAIDASKLNLDAGEIKNNIHWILFPAMLPGLTGRGNCIVLKGKKVM